MTAFTFYMDNADLQIAQKHARSIAGHPAPDHPIIPTTTTGITEKRKLIPTSISTTRLKGIVAHLFNVRPLSIKLIWESEEWDPVLLDEEEERGWSVSEDEDEDEDEDSDERNLANKKNKKNNSEKKEEKQHWKRRELELPDSTREVGFFVDVGGGRDGDKRDREARVRVELR